jgi:DNA-binding transcriptional regulator YiaG
MRRYDELLTQGTSPTTAQVEIAHRLDVSAATVQRWIRDDRNRARRDNLVADARAAFEAAKADQPDFAHVAEDTPTGRKEREDAYYYFGRQLQSQYEIALAKQREFREKFSTDPEGYLSATLQLAAVNTTILQTVVKNLILLGSSNEIATNRLAGYSDIPEATVRKWEREAEANMEDPAAENQ